MLTLDPITLNNLEIAVSVQHELFPFENCDARINYVESINGLNTANYYLIKNDGFCIGITGIYTCKSDVDSAWLGWFGILAPYRKQHFGTQAMQLFEDLARERGFKYVRVYTDAEDNDIAISFYKANGYVCEEYNNPIDDPACIENKVLICSKSLDKSEVVLWNNRNIYLTEQIQKQSAEE